MKQIINELKAAIENRTETHYGIYHDVGQVLNDFTTLELVEYFTDVLNSEGTLRYFLEQQITAAEIAKLRR